MDIMQYLLLAESELVLEIIWGIVWCRAIKVLDDDQIHTICCALVTTNSLTMTISKVQT